MSLPPEDVSDEDLFRKLLERPAPSEVYDWPGRNREFKIRMEVLRTEDRHNCQLKAQHWWDEGSGKTQEQQGLLAREIMADRVACEILAKCVTRTKPIEGTEERGATAYARVFPNADGVRKALFDKELQALWNCYLLLEHKYAPGEDGPLTAEERNAWVKKLAKGGDCSPFLRMPLPQQLTMTASLAAEKLVLSGVLRSLSTSLPECWVSALARLPFDIFSSGWPAVSCTPEAGLTLEWDTVPEPELPPIDRSYIDVREIAQDLVREASLAALTPDQED